MLEIPTNEILALLLLIVSCSTSKVSDQIPKKHSFNKKALQKECDEGKQRSCSKLVDVIHATEGFLPAHRFAKAQCAAGLKDFCFYRVKVLYFDGQVDEGVTELKKLCDKNDPFACNMLGSRVLVDNYYTKKSSAPNSYYQKACKLGDRYSCLIEYINTGSQDSKKLDQYFPVSDNVANRILVFLDNFKKSRFALWENIVERLCKAGNQNACFREKIELNRNHTLTSEEADIAKEFCDQGHETACESLCLQSEEFKTAARYCEKSCFEQNSNEACYSVALNDGYDKETIEQLFKFGCVKNDLTSCKALARLKYEEKDNEGYKNLLRLNCDLGDIASCEATGTYHALYVGESAATPFFEKTCSYGSVSGCLLNCQNEIRQGNLTKARKVLENLCKNHTLDTCPKPYNKKLNDEELTLACRL